MIPVRFDHGLTPGRRKGHYLSYVQRKLLPLLTSKYFLVGILFLFVFWQTLSLHFEIDPPVSAVGVKEKYTIVVSGFRGPGLLKQVLEKHSTCELLESIHVVWSDEDGVPPNVHDVNFIKLPEGHVPIHFDVYRTDSISNRFHPIDGLTTEAVFTMDDGVLVDCESMKFAFEVWRSSRRAIVGFEPRLHDLDRYTTNLSYLGWWSVWWNNSYSMILTKACFLHKDYLEMYMNLPPTMLDYINDRGYCEDIAMNFVVARASQSPPIWVKGGIVEVGSTDMYSEANTIKERGHCMDEFSREFGGSPLVESHQRAIRVGDYWI